jgi:hypothetical protein
MHASYLAPAEAAGLPYVVLTGTHAERLERARAAVSDVRTESAGSLRAG